MTADKGWDAQALRERINAYPPYVGAKIEVTHVAEDASEIRVQMPLDRDNANLVGTHFGGSLFAMVDPHLMILLQARLGPDYSVWDRSATIHFVRPGRSTVYATIRIDESEVDAIRGATEDGGKHHPQWTVEVKNGDGEVVATVLKTLYVRRRKNE